MSTSPNIQGEKPTKSERSAVATLLGDIGSTTWRMFLPTIGLAFLGYMADDRYGFSPWLMLAGAAVGAVIAGLLIKRQLMGIHD